MTGFEVLLVATAVVRGMGAGIIYDSAVVSPRVRHRVGLPAYADYLRANLAGLFRVTRTPRDEHDRLAERLDHYAGWYAFSALWQAAAFLAAVVALASV